MKPDSELVQYVDWSPNYTEVPDKVIDTIVIHHMAGMLSVETMGQICKSRAASTTYAIGTDGRIGQYVPESVRQWCTSSFSIDSHSVTIECANDSTAPNWHVSDLVISRCIELCIDICKRNNIKKITFTGDKEGNLQMHRYWANTLCPGNYLASMFPYIAEQINKGLKGVNPSTILYCVQVGAYSTYGNAVKATKELKALGYSYYIPRGEDGLYRVQIGAFAIPRNAKLLCEELKNNGFADAFIAKKKVDYE
ncbi:MAG: cell division protein [Erysipelotrichaceae bacterium]|nr:cell division protein [Erysipelotrichaceae bacterium]